MARGSAARGRAGGGGFVPAAGRHRARIAVAVVAVGSATAFAATVALATERLPGGVAAVGFLGALLVAAGVAVARDGLLPPGLGLLGAAYALSLFLRDGALDPWAPLAAAGLVLVAELAYWSLELKTPVGAERGIVARRGALVAAVAGGAAPAGAAVLAAATVSVAGGLLWTSAGVAAAVAAIGIAAWAAWASAARG